ncbi:hypothetical protein F5B21DRAFT_527078 [Xylaria acuta]|nr:hypothetical protein F5B21DRAFT_527078 [Xylaria acuta]
MPIDAGVEEIARRARQPGAGMTRTRTQRSSLRDISMEVDGRVDNEEEEEEEEEDAEAVYTADLQVEETSAQAEASIEAGSPLSTQQRRQLRSHTVRLGRRASFSIPAHARGSSDTTGGVSTMGVSRTGTGMTPRTGFTSINAPRDGYDGRAAGVGALGGGVDGDGDRMWLD